jgi:hypothetical protein
VAAVEERAGITVAAQAAATAVKAAGGSKALAVQVAGFVAEKSILAKGGDAFAAGQCLSFCAV